MAWRPSAVICGEFAAQLTFWRDLEVADIELAAKTEIRREGFRFSERTIPPSLQTRLGHFQITTPALTALDLSLVHGAEAIDRALRSRLVTVELLQTALDQSSNRRGNRDRRRLVLDSRTRPWSAAERLAHNLLAEAGITGWVANLPLKVDLWQVYLDIAFIGVKLVLEIDGYEVHSQRDVFEEDRDRQNELVLRDWTVLRFTYRQLAERPGYVIDTVRRGLRFAARKQRLLERPRTGSR